MDRFTKHLWVMELIQLFLFSSLSIILGIHNFNFSKMNFLSTCSDGVIDCDVIEYMTVWIISVNKLSLEKVRPEYRASLLSSRKIIIYWIPRKSIRWCDKWHRSNISIIQWYTFQELRPMRMTSSWQQVLSSIISGKGENI